MSAYTHHKQRYMFAQGMTCTNTVRTRSERNVCVNERASLCVFAMGIKFESAGCAISSSYRRRLEHAFARIQTGEGNRYTSCHHTPHSPPKSQSTHTKDTPTAASHSTISPTPTPAPALCYCNRKQIACVHVFSTYISTSSHVVSAGQYYVHMFLIILFRKRQHTLTHT